MNGDLLTPQQRRYVLLATGALGGGTFLFSNNRASRVVGGGAFFLAAFFWFREFGGLPSVGSVFGPGASVAPGGTNPLLAIPLTPQHVVRLIPGICRDPQGNITPPQTLGYPYAEVTLAHLEQALSPGGGCEGASPYSSDDARIIAAYNAQRAAGLFG